MKELSDKQFDALLKQKAESFDHDFDESAWNKMEQKLRRKDRIIFFRNSSFVLALLLLCGGIYLSFDKEPITNSKKQFAKESKTIAPHKKPAVINAQKLNEPASEQSLNPASEAGQLMSQQLKVPLKAKLNNEVSQNSIIDKPAINESSTFESSKSLVISAPPSSTLPIGNSSISTEAADSNALSLATATPDTAAVEKNVKKRRQLVFSITAMAGPEFSSLKSFSASKGTLNAGFLLNAELSNKIIVSTGLKYGIKNYAASSYDYQLQNPSRASLISGIDASCNILEIPLQISYTLFNEGNKQIRISSGLSSYLMLKEAYNFKYTAQSGYKDYLLVKSNANQHYLSVLSLSASYLIKPKSSHLQWAIEPYVKLPMGGVGEGNVRLKSSGISLNLTYDLRKKSK